MIEVLMDMYNIHTLQVSLVSKHFSFQTISSRILDAEKRKQEDAARNMTKN